MEMRFTLLFLLMFISNNIIAQNMYIVKFDTVTTDTDVLVTHRLLESTKLKSCPYLKGIPKDCKVYGIYSISFNNNQQSNIYNSNKKEKNHNKLYYYVGVNKEKKEKYIILDSNFNLDLNDDSIYTFSFKYYGLNGYQEAPFVRIPIYPYYFNGTKYLQVKSSITMFPYIPSGNENEDNYYLNTDIATNAYAKGYVHINNDQIRINESTTTLEIIPQNINTKSQFNFIGTKDTINISYNIKDTVELADRKIYLEKVEANQLFLKDLGAFNDSSSIGNNIPNLYAYSLEENKKVNLNKYINNNYVLIDFWGSWCGPCIASIPIIKDVHEQIEHYKNAMILGVALEEDNDVEKAKAIILEKDIRWLNVWGRYKESTWLTSIHGKLKIYKYPTLLVIDKHGIIRARSDKMPANNPKEARKKVIDIFITLVKQNK